MDFKFDKERLTNIFNLMNKYNTVNLAWKGSDSVKGICKASKSGHGSNLFDKLHPTSYEDFYMKLFNYAQENQSILSIYDRGLTPNELRLLGEEFKRNAESIDPTLPFTLDNYIDYIMYVNVIQTFDGHINEVMLVDYINKYWYNDAHKAQGILDSQYGVDILYKNDTRGIQVKSINFFLGNKQSTINDRENIEPLKNEVKSKFNIDMKYAIFDRKSNKYLQSSNNTPVFSFEEFNAIMQSNERPHKVFKYPQISVNK